jgi:hypothetical protein
MATDSIYTLEDITYGQARINYQLVKVDETLIAGLNALVEILKTLKAERVSAHGAKEMDLSGVVEILEKASEISQKVAEIKPPGCEAPYPD